MPPFKSLESAKTLLVSEMFCKSKHWFSYNNNLRFKLSCDVFSFLSAIYSAFPFVSHMNENFCFYFISSKTDSKRLNIFTFVVRETITRRNYLTESAMTTVLKMLIINKYKIFLYK